MFVYVLVLKKKRDHNAFWGATEKMGPEKTDLNSSS